MNFALLRKELAGLRMSMALVLAATLLEVAYIMVTGFPDRQPFDLDETDVTGLFFALYIGVHVLNLEREGQTLSFLDGLPVTRWKIFIHKTLAALLVAALAVIVPLVFSLLLGWWSRHSTSEPWAWRNIALMNGTRFLLCAVVVMAAMALSFTRQWFPLLSGLGFWAFIWLRATGWEWTSWLDSAALIRLTTDDQGVLQVPRQALEGHLALGLAAWLFAGLGFNWRDGRINRWLDKISAWRFSAWLTGFGRLAAVVVWLYALAQLGGDSGASIHSRPEATAAGVSRSRIDTGGKPKDEVVGFASTQTKYYELVFRESQRKQVLGDPRHKDVQPLVAGLDAVHDQVNAFFQQPVLPPERIVVDVASLVARHAAGQTNWTKIRIPLAEGTSREEFRQILRHETAHVYIEQLSQGQASSYFKAMRCFHEGVATAAELSSNESLALGDRVRMERWAAGTDARGHVKLEGLCSDEKLSHDRDPAIVYPLGYVFARALIEAGGPSLPRRVVESLARTPPPPGATTTELWRHVLQNCGTSFDLVVSDYEETLAALRRQEKPFLDRFPRLTATVRTEGDEVIITPSPLPSGPVPAKITCMIESDLGMVKQNEGVPARDDGTFHVPRSAFSGTTLRYMLGWRAKDLRYPLFEAWTSAAVK